MNKKEVYAAPFAEEYFPDFDTGDISGIWTPEEDF